MFSDKTIWKIATPIMLGSLAQVLITLTDTAFLGRISELALGASLMAGIYYYVCSTLAWGLATGIQIMVARRFGEENYKRIGVIFEHGLVLVTIVGVMMLGIMKFLSPFFLKSLISSDEVYQTALQFIDYRCFGIVFVCVNYLFRALYIGIGSTNVITITTVVMAVVNIVLDYVLVFGKWGFPNLGIEGAAIASVIAEITAMVFFFVYTQKRVDTNRFALFKFHPLESPLFKTILNISIPTMTQKLLSFGAWLVFFSFVEKMGERALASATTVRSIYMLCSIPVFAFAAAANSLVSRVIGSGQSDKVAATIKKIIKLCFITLLPIVALMALFPSLMLSIYTDNSELIVYTINSVYSIAVVVCSMALGFILFEAISGTGNTHHAMYLEAVALVFYLIYSWIATSKLHLSVEIVWLADGVYSGVLILGSLLYLKFYRWDVKRRVV